MELLILLVVVLVLSPIVIGVWKLKKGLGGRTSSETLTKDRRRIPDRREMEQPVPGDRREGPRREHEVAEDFVDRLKPRGR